MTASKKKKLQQNFPQNIGKKKLSKKIFGPKEIFDLKKNWD